MAALVVPDRRATGNARPERGTDGAGKRMGRFRGINQTSTNTVSLTMKGKTEGGYPRPGAGLIFGGVGVRAGQYVRPFVLSNPLRKSWISCHFRLKEPIYRRRYCERLAAIKNFQGHQSPKVRWPKPHTDLSFFRPLLHTGIISLIASNVYQIGTKSSELVDKVVYWYIISSILVDWLLSDMTTLTPSPNSTRHYSTEPFTTAQVDAARRILHRDGWEYKEDRFYPTTDPRRKGWWVNTYNPEMTQHSRPRGDSKDFWYATQCTYRLYSGHSDEELS